MPQTNTAANGVTIYEAMRAGYLIITTDPWELDLSNHADITVVATPYNYPSLRAINVLGNHSLVSLEAGNCPMLGTVKLEFASLTNLNLNACGITDVAKIDAILIGLDDAGLMNGNVNVHSGTNAVPGPGGAAAAASLTEKGWAVFTN